MSAPKASDTPKVAVRGLRKSFGRKVVLDWPQPSEAPGGPGAASPCGGSAHEAVSHGVAISRLCRSLWGLSGHAVGLAGRGKMTLTDRPPPGLGQAETVASCAVAMARTMDSPSPCPSA